MDELGTHNAVTTSQSALKCLYFNADQLQNKLNELEIFLHKENVDIAAIVEISPKTRDLGITDFIIEGYKKPIIRWEGRGVCLFVKDHIELIEYPELENLYQPSIFCKVVCSKEQFFNLGVVYRSPNIDPSDDLKLRTQLDRVSQRFKSSNERLLIVGDFNHPYINWKDGTCNKHSNHTSSLFLEIIHKNFLSQLVKTPTHHRAMQRPTLIDLVILNDRSLVSDDITHHPPLGMSHHSVLCFKVNIEIHKQVNPTDPKFQINRGDFDSMRNYVRSVDWNTMLDNDSSLDIWWENFYETYNYCVEHFIPKA